MMSKYTIPVLLVAALCGACAGKTAPNTATDPAQQGSVNRDRDLITREELMAPGGMGAQTLYTAIKTLRPTFLTNRGLQSYNNCKNATDGTTACSADPDAGSVHVSVDNGRILPLDELQTVSRGARVGDIEKICADTGYSRFPVDHEGDLVGYLHIKDVLETDPHGRTRVVEDKWIRAFANVRPGDTLQTGLAVLQAKGAHMARVVDDDGTLLGIVTLEDVIEELVGEIRDASHADGH